MPVNDNKPQPKPEEILTEIFSSIFGTPTKTTPAAPAVDPIAEANRLLKRAEAVANEDSLESGAYISIADRHIKIIELALAYQK